MNKDQYGKQPRGLRSPLGALLTVAVILLLVLLITDYSEAAEEEVTTGKGGWDWTFWGTGQESDTGRSRAYGRVYNRETGEYLKSGWYIVDGAWYYFTAKGYTVDQFHGGCKIGDNPGLGVCDAEEDPEHYRWKETDDGHWMYVASDTGAALKDRRAWISGRLYIFDENGYLPKVGWYNWPGDDCWYYILPSQACTTGWKKIGGKWYFFDYTTGQMAQGGSYDTSAPFAAKKQYYIFNASGAMRTFEGWYQAENGDWFRSDVEGRAVLGWATIGGKDYYFEPAVGGIMAESREGLDWFQGGRYIRTDGTATPKRYGWHADGDLWWFGRGSYYAADETVIINGWAYHFNSDGYCEYGMKLNSSDEIYYIHEEDESVKQWDESINLSEQDFYLLAATVYTEAGSEEYEGQIAVANVLLNRLRSGKYGETLEDVVYQPYQFSVTGSRSFKRSLIHGGSSTAMQAAREAMQGKNVIGGFDSFRMHKGYDLSRLKSEYYILGSHVFYSEW